MPNPRDVIHLAAETLAAAGIDSARVEAELLLLHTLGLTKTQLVLLDEISNEQVAAFQELVNLRATRIPLQHIIGRAAFRHIEVNVGEGVLTPRPETELLVDAAIAHIDTAIANQKVVVDLCSGSAALSISLAIELAPAQVYALEYEDAAFAWGERNAAEYQNEITSNNSSLELVKGDVVGCETRELKHLVGQADIVVSNPPYIPLWAVPRDPEVHLHEPAAALYGGEDGMQFVGAVIDAAFALLKPGGLVAIEHGDLQGETGEVSVPRALREHGGFVNVQDHLDLAQRPRYTTGVRK
jgi:release factor glutamine methyltransferase